MIQPHPDAPLGSVTTLASYSSATFTSGAAVLCRNNAPLVAHAFAAIRRDIPVRILGRELGDGLAKIVKSFKASGTGFTWQETMYEKLTLWHDREVRRLRRPSQRDALDDKRQCLYEITKASVSEADALARIDRLFVASVDTTCLTLSTGHKAKGQEWDHVFILDQHLIPSRWADDEASLTQERNLLYVMITRARHTLTYIKSNCWTTP